MPFVSKSQYIACLYAQERSRQKHGARKAKSRWDCDKWLKETKNFDKLPFKVTKKATKPKKKPVKRTTKTVVRKTTRTSKTKPKKMVVSGRSRTVYTGPKGGKYVMVYGRKRYIG